MTFVRMTGSSQSWASWPVRALLLALVFAVGAAAIPFGAPELAAPTNAQAQEQPQADEGEEVIVVLEDGVNPAAAAKSMGVKVHHIYRHVFNGFAGTMDADAIVTAQSLDTVKRISPDAVVSAEAQTVGTGVSRVGMPRVEGTNNLAIASPIDADIAILDTGVTPQADLNVVGGKACVKDSKDSQNKKSSKKKKKGSGKGKNGKKDKKKNKKNKRKSKAQKQKNSGQPWRDDNGHGSHTAGIAAAFDNDQGIVGVAPGARIWAVKVLDSRGSGTFSDVICGLDWVAANKDVVDVVNLSLSGVGSEGNCQTPAFHRAICAVVAAGVPVVAAAGNQGQDVAGNAKNAGRVPARYDEVITVSGFADSDGQPGGNGPTPCFNDQDDTFLEFSNFGPDIDIMAPGDCILSVSKNGSLVRESGTSESSPHVAGAAAVFIAQQTASSGTRPTPDETKTWLLTEASRSQSEDGLTGDPDGVHEPVLWLAVLGQE